VESKIAKYGFWGVVIAAVITGAIGLYIHLDGKAEAEKFADSKQEADKSKNTANLTISNIYVPPINTSLDSAFFVQIQNNSLNLAKDVVVKINFGESSVSSCETMPAKLISNEKIVSSIISFSVGDIQRKDSLYVYCLLSHPVFESILLTGSNLFSNELYEFKQYIPSTKDNNSSFIKFFKVIASIVAVIFIGYFTILTLSALNRRFGVDPSKW
jgi:hypothetical protein